MIKEFYALFAALFFMVLFMALFVLFYDFRGVNSANSAIVALIKQDTLSYAPSRYEELLRIDKPKGTNSIYAELPQIDYLDYLYAK